MTFIYEAAEQIKDIGKQTYIYHLGDFDPSGVDAAYRSVTNKTRRKHSL